MYRIAIVEDDQNAAEVLRSYLQRYEEENGEQFSVSSFANGLLFLKEQESGFDIVFMDIEMPALDGMETAKLLRRVNDISCLIFVTNMASYAIKGYEVDAMDFLVKPVSYPLLAFKLGKALSISKRRSREELVLRTKDGIIRIKISDLYYAESSRHRVLYHTANGVVECWSSLAKEEKQLLEHGFARCHTSFLVNLRHVTKVENGSVFLGTTQLDLSRGKKAEFLRTLTQYLGG